MIIFCKVDKPTLTLRPDCQCCVSVAVFIAIKGIGDARNVSVGEAKGTLHHLIHCANSTAHKTLPAQATT